MKSKRLMTIGIVLALLIAVVGVVLSVSLTACGQGRYNGAQRKRAAQSCRYKSGKNDSPYGRRGCKRRFKGCRAQQNRPQRLRAGGQGDAVRRRQRHACRRHDGADSCPPRNGQGAENRYKYAPRPRGVERAHRFARHPPPQARTR